MPIVLDHSHSDEVVLVLWRIDDRSAIGMVSDLVITDSGVADTADSVLRRSIVGQADLHCRRCKCPHGCQGCSS
jgi:hypothetical protein